MGVNGLWQVVQPCARPTNLATLNRKRLAVDASIWIYQFLKAVRDKEGNALRNSHVVGFFRRICKLLWFGINPVFVFDGGAPALKRQTIMNRKRRREGRRDDAVRTAGKLLAVQMQRLAEEEGDKKRRRVERGAPLHDEPVEQIPDANQLVYVDEIGMSKQERQRTRKFHKKDAYHLPELDGSIASMGKPDDPRIMSVDELEEYARQFHNGEDINLYDFGKVDFDGDFFKSLPPADRYNILNAARLRSRLRMGLGKEQLEDMFPDRMAFSRFQIERVKERNRLTQRLMHEIGMNSTDLTIAVNGRIAGEKNREYILVKNDGVEGGWALGVVSKEKDTGGMHKPIDVDALQFQYQTKDEQEDWEDDDDFEDVPIEGLNRLPKLPERRGDATLDAEVRFAGRKRQPYHHPHAAPNETGEDEDEDSLFVGGTPSKATEAPPKDAFDGVLLTEEEADINKAIALSLLNQHGIGLDFEEEEDAEEEFEDVDMPAPEWSQKTADAPKPITKASGRMVAHIVNNRSSAAVPKPRHAGTSSDRDRDSDSDVDLQTALAMSRKAKRAQPVPVHHNVRNPFDGPLPFPKLDWTLRKKPNISLQQTETNSAADATDDEEMAGGFEKVGGDATAPRPLPPWLASDTDILESLKKQQAIQEQINAEDREMAQEEERAYRKQQQEQLIEIASSSDDADDSDVEILDVPPSLRSNQNTLETTTPLSKDTRVLGEMVLSGKMSGPSQQDAGAAFDSSPPEISKQQSSIPSLGVDLEEIQLPERSSQTVAGLPESGKQVPGSPEPEFEDVPESATAMEQPENRRDPNTTARGEDQDDDAFFAADDYDEFSDPEEEELLAQMAEEADEHARFASELNNKSERENRESYEKELRALRSQQKKDRRDADEVTEMMVTECQALLRLFGIPYISAPMEAEAQCAELVHLGLVDGIVTDDSDIFLFGGTRVYKNMFNGNKFVECYLSSDLEKELSLSREQLIALAQLLGSDYTDGLPGVGPVTAVEILSEFPGANGLDQFRDWWQDVQTQNRPKDADAASPFRKKFRKTQSAKLFLPPGFPSPAVFDAYLHPEVDSDTEPFRWGVPDLEGLRRFLMSTIGWSKERTDEVLVPVIKDMNKREVEGTQTNITRYFEGSVGVGAREAFAPRQRVQASKRMVNAVSRLRGRTGRQGGEEKTSPAGAKRKRSGKPVGTTDDSGDGDEMDGTNEREESDEILPPRGPPRRTREKKATV